MTETEKKALALLNEFSDYEVPDLDEAQYSTAIQALCRAIGQHEAFKLEVSDAVEHYLDQWRHSTPSREVFACQFGSFIISKTDPLVEALKAALWDISNVRLTDGELARISNTIAASGLEVRKIGEGE